MKVLSLTEPYASLIYYKKKKIETRSWKTNYRGELFIHASKTKIKKEDFENPKFVSLFQDLELHFGTIICKCQLTDVILMTQEFIDEMKQNDPIEYLCGDYQVGRYAWILEDITPLSQSIYVKGRLGIWNYEKNSR